MGTRREECEGGLTFPVGLGGVNPHEGLSVSDLREYKKVMLRLVEAAECLFEISSWFLSWFLILSGLRSNDSSLGARGARADGTPVFLKAAHFEVRPTGRRPRALQP
eukprot:scaffold20896_cov134-Isochrysis_galbana.AAC.1